MVEITEMVKIVSNKLLDVLESIVFVVAIIPEKIATYRVKRRIKLQERLERELLLEPERLELAGLKADRIRARAKLIRAKTKVMEAEYGKAK